MQILFQIPSGWKKKQNIPLKVTLKWIACCEWTQSLSAECTFCGPVIMLMLCVKAPLFTYISTDFDCTQSTVFCMTFLRGSRLPTYPHFVCVVLALPFLSGHPSGYGLVQEELLSPASMQYSLPSPLGIEPYWQEVSSLESAPIATTEEDTLMEMSDVQVWPAGVSPSLVTVEDSSLDGSSRADDSEANTLSLPCKQFGEAQQWSQWGKRLHHGAGGRGGGRGDWGKMTYSTSRCRQAQQKRRGPVVPSQRPTITGRLEVRGRRAKGQRWQRRRAAQFDGCS